jgi:hypothetical protein
MVQRLKFKVLKRVPSVLLPYSLYTLPNTKVGKIWFILTKKSQMLNLQKLPLVAEHRSFVIVLLKK